ncbi:MULTISPECIES: DUF3566 domain-containing protein [Arthrobacter]|uniref:DUF3566 domain-containing protein n=2 Tax=Arthrobacter TaxID=1663 RepID=A0ABU9KJ21_9MICC|nr:DUF3566 domain-containing protein [Arthrobacter sp. YJM1]MDP5226880.1 DUF3566 domain-containing protein [Arthrobacter sp. YJM1]
MSSSNPSPFESRPQQPHGDGSRNPSGGSAAKGAPAPRPVASPFPAPQQQPRPQAAPAQSGTAQPAATRPVQAQQRPAAAPSSARPRVAQAPAGQSGDAVPGLVKPAPKAKVRRARLMVSKIDPWSVLKMSFLLSVALGIVTVVAALVLWTVLDLTGIFNQVNKLVGDVAGSESGGFDLRKVASLGQVVSFSTIIAVVNVVLLTAISTLSAVLYNLAATLVGGVGVTLTDD